MKKNFLKEDTLTPVSEIIDRQSCANCVYYNAEKNWCDNSPYVFASAGGFLLYTWLGNPEKQNKCPVFKEK